MQREFRIFRALGLTVSAWFRNFVPFTLLAAVLYAPVVAYILTYDVDRPRRHDELMRTAFELPMYAVVGLSALLAPLLTYRVVQELGGHRVSMRTSIRLGLRGIVPALVLAFITGAVELLPFGGFLNAILTSTWFVAAPAAVAERRSPFAAFPRSAALTRGRRWAIFGLTFAVTLVLIGLMWAWVIPSIEGRGELSSLRARMFFVLGALAVFQTFVGVAQAVSYALLREEKDGVSSDELARVFE